MSKENDLNRPNQLLTRTPLSRRSVSTSNRSKQRVKFRQAIIRNPLFAAGRPARGQFTQRNRFTANRKRLMYVSDHVSSPLSDIRSASQIMSSTRTTEDNDVSLINSNLGMYYKWILEEIHFIFFYLQSTSHISDENIEQQKSQCRENMLYDSDEMIQFTGKNCSLDYKNRCIY